jgi:hypothetical protein
MTRYVLLFLLTFSAAAAANEDLPIPPLPPPQVPLTEIAPLPDPNAQAPVTPGSDQASLNVKFYRAKTYDPSEGFTPGSRYQTSEDRKPIQTPGLSVSVPIQ